jgi:hypothetical protein
MPRGSHILCAPQCLLMAAMPMTVRGPDVAIRLRDTSDRTDFRDGLSSSVTNIACAIRNEVSLIGFTSLGACRKNKKK